MYFMGFTKHQRVATKYIDTLSYTYSFMHANTVRVSQISQVLFCCTRQHHICDATKRQNAILFSSAYLLQQSVIKKVDFFSMFIKKNALALLYDLKRSFCAPFFTCSLYRFSFYRQSMEQRHFQENFVIHLCVLVHEFAAL